MTHPVQVLEGARSDLLQTIRRLDTLHHLRAKASQALTRNDVVACAATLAVLAQIGGKLFAFEVPANPCDVARWHVVVERIYCALEESTKHANGMLARLNTHLANPRPSDPAWVSDVARTVVLQERHLRQQQFAASIHADSAEAMSP